LQSRSRRHKRVVHFREPDIAKRHLVRASMRSLPLLFCSISQVDKMCQHTSLWYDSAPGWASARHQNRAPRGRIGALEGLVADAESRPAAGCVDPDLAMANNGDDLLVEGNHAASPASSIFHGKGSMRATQATAARRARLSGLTLRNLMRLSVPSRPANTPYSATRSFWKRTG